MTPSTVEETTATPGLSNSGTPPAVNAKQPGASGRMYRVLWRWHFYAGMIITPALIVVAATGGLYIFKDELAAVVYPGVTYVEPSAARTSYEEQVAAVRANVPGTQRPVLLQVFTDPRRATGMVMLGGKGEFSYVDPYRGHYLGDIARGSFFDIVLDLHRTLFLGTTGRIVVELTTCWSIVLAATGLYLWWPKGNKLWGVWLPRMRRKPYVVLRDLHSVSGMYVAILAIIITLTGLIYTFVWGTGYQYVSKKTDAYDMFSKSMVCKSPPEAKDLPIDRFIEVAQKRMPGNNLTVWYPRIPNGVYLVTANNDLGPQVNRMLFIDRATGEILEDRFNSQNKVFYQIGTWNYTLHVGSVLGMTSKILWFLTCVVLMTLPVTGIWMWWERRPKGRLGLPRRIVAPRPLWLVVTIIATSILLPALGLSVVVVLVFDLLVLRLRRAWA